MFLHRIKIFTLAGFTVWIDASWLILAALFTWTLAVGIFPALAPRLPVATYWWMGVAGTIGLFFSIVLHELSHSLVARRFSMPIAGITLFVFGGVAELHREPTSARAEFLMAIVGPLTSMAIGTVLLAGAAVGGRAMPLSLFALLYYLGSINWILAIFNLVPAFPLDGGRVLRSALWGWKNDYAAATRIAAAIGKAFGVLLILAGAFGFLRGNLIGGLWLFFIGLFLHGAAGASRQQLDMRRLFSGRPVSFFMQRDPVSVSPDLTVRAVVENYFYHYHFSLFPVLQNGELVGSISTEELRTAPRAQWDAMTVGQTMQRCGPAFAIAPDADALDALTQMQSTGRRRLLVTQNGKLVGVLSLSDMLHYLSLRQELESGEPGDSQQTLRSQYSRQ